jgi:hypothetical protein
MRKLQEPRVAGFLQKPYKPALLVEKVHAILEGAVVKRQAG